MGHQKSLNDLHIDDLLKIASQPSVKKVKKPKTNPEIDKFISENQIISGRRRIPTYIIYYRYFLWKQTRLIPRRKFLEYFKTKFEKVQTIDGVGFLLNPKGFDLTPGGFFRARKLLRDEKEKKAINKTTR